MQVLDDRTVRADNLHPVAPGVDLDLVQPGPVAEDAHGRDPVGLCLEGDIPPGDVVGRDGHDDTVGTADAGIGDTLEGEVGFGGVWSGAVGSGEVRQGKVILSVGRR